MKLKQYIIGLGVMALLAAGCSNSNTTSNQTPSAPDITQNTTGNGLSPTSTDISGGTASGTPQQVNVTLDQVNNSKESGTATLVATGSTTVVTLTVTGEPKGAIQPVHIHVGSCPGVGAVKYPLANVVNGISTTTVNMPLATILSQLPLAINAHKSAAAINTYVTCGQIQAP